MTVRVVSPPAGGLISLVDAKAHLRVDTDDEDDLISAVILAAGDLIEQDVQRRFLAQQLEWVLHDWAHGLRLPIAGATNAAGVLAIGQVRYAALDGSTQILDPSLYWDRPSGETRELHRRWGVIWPLLGDAAERLVITMVVTGDPTTVPARAQHACKLLVSHLYANREAVVGVEARDSSTPLPFGVEQLLSPLRWS